MDNLWLASNFLFSKKIYPVHHAIKSTRQLWIGSGLEPVKQCHIYPTRPEPTFCQLKIPQYDDDKKDQIYYPSRYIVTTKIHSQQQHMSSIQQIQQQNHHHSHHIRFHHHHSNRHHPNHHHPNHPHDATSSLSSSDRRNDSHIPILNPHRPTAKQTSMDQPTPPLSCKPSFKTCLKPISFNKPPI